MDGNYVVDSGQVFGGLAYGEVLTGSDVLGISPEACLVWLGSFQVK